MRQFVLISRSGRKHSFAPVAGRSLEEEVVRQARHLGEEVERVVELVYNPQGRSPWERRERPDLASLVQEGRGREG